MSLILGKNVVMYAYSGGQWKPIVCGLSCSFTTSAGTIGTSITGTGAWETSEYTSLSWKATFEGLIYLQKVNTLALPDMRSLQYARQKVLFRYQRTDNSSNVYLEEGQGLLTNISDAGPNDSVATFSVEIQGTGPLTQIFTPTIVNPNGKVKRKDFTGTNTDTYTFSDLNLIDLLDVVVDGGGRAEIITSGTPLNQEVKYTSAGGSGTLVFPQIINTGTKCYALYQDI